MPLKLTNFNLYVPRSDGDGLRVATVRHLPRGVPKCEWQFDTWLPLLAPSAELLADFKQGKLSDTKFFQRYRAEMKCPDPRHVIELLAAVAEKTPVAVGCHCEDASRCHRTTLEELIRQAASA